MRLPTRPGRPIWSPEFPGASGISAPPPPTQLSGTQGLLLSGKVSQLRDKCLAQSGAHSRCLINAKWMKEGTNGGMSEGMNGLGEHIYPLKTTLAAAPLS